MSRRAKNRTRRPGRLCAAVCVCMCVCLSSLAQCVVGAETDGGAAAAAAVANVGARGETQASRSSFALRSVDDGVLPSIRPFFSPPPAIDATADRRTYSTGGGGDGRTNGWRHSRHPDPFGRQSSRSPACGTATHMHLSRKVLTLE